LRSEKKVWKLEKRSDIKYGESHDEMMGYKRQIAKKKVKREWIPYGDTASC
jgi:hypothetical protein